MNDWTKQSLVAVEADSDPRPVVLYRKVEGFNISVGFPAVVYPVNHYSQLVSGYADILTSHVLAYDKATGAFETKNTRYVLDTSVLH